MKVSRLIIPGLCLALLCLFLDFAWANDPNALWKIVGQCVQDEAGHGRPAPCERVDRAGGFVVLKDRVGVAQYLVMPTRRIAGVESPSLLAEGSPNYWAFAWQTRSAVEARLHRRLRRDEIALAVNSVYGRSQNQLHIHVDCIRPDVLRGLRRRASTIGFHWAPLGMPLQGHRYFAMRVDGPDLGNHDPFKLLAGGLPGARRHMDRRTLVVTGAEFDHTSGFILLTDQADLAAGDRASGEELLDHDCTVAEKN